MEKAPGEQTVEIKRMQNLADELEKIVKENGETTGPTVKLIKILRTGDKEKAISCCRNELFDKFGDSDAKVVEIIIEKLFGGSGSPWKRLEHKK